MGNILVICDSEKVYGQRLYEYLSKRQTQYSEIKLFSSVALMKNNLSGSHIDLLLIDELSYVEFLDSGCKDCIRVDKIKLLTAKRPEPGMIAEESIYKYQSAKDILHNITPDIEKHAADDAINIGSNIGLADSKKKHTMPGFQSSL